MKRGIPLAILLAALAGVVYWALRQFRLPAALPEKPRTISQVVEVLAPRIRPILKSDFARAGLPFPPSNVTLLAFKEERRLELWSRDSTGSPHLIKTYEILGASGGPGPKLREGDRQVPEGFYRIELLNPNSKYHLSLRVNYPNADDIANARAEDRDLKNLGGDIMIHGGSGSSGCLAMGDEAVEEIFYLGSQMDLDDVRLTILPSDLRKTPASVPEDAPTWTAALYERLHGEASRFPLKR